jgi:hypothetical protein
MSHGMDVAVLDQLRCRQELLAEADARLRRVDDMVALVERAVAKSDALLAVHAHCRRLFNHDYVRQRPDLAACASLA